MKIAGSATAPVVKPMKLTGVSGMMGGALPSNGEPKASRLRGRLDGVDFDAVRVPDDRLALKLDGGGYLA